MFLSAGTCTDREIEPAVDESFVVMFEEQFAPDASRDTIPRCRAQLVIDNTVALH